MPIPVGAQLTRARPVSIRDRECERRCTRQRSDSGRGCDRDARCARLVKCLRPEPSRWHGDGRLQPGVAASSRSLGRPRPAGIRRTAPIRSATPSVRTGTAGGPERVRPSRRVEEARRAKGCRRAHRGGVRSPEGQGARRMTDRFGHSGPVAPLIALPHPGPGEADGRIGPMIVSSLAHTGRGEGGSRV